MCIEVIKRRETVDTISTLVEDEEGNEVWYMVFNRDNHPVNKKWFRMSGAEPNETN